MSRAVILANGPVDKTTDISSLLHADDILIAADGGASRFQSAGIQPHVVVGDMDSIDPALLEKLKSKGIELIGYPKDKDQTDLELAIHFAVGRGMTEILLLGLVGGRLDQTLANLLMLTRPEWGGIRLIVKDGMDTAYPMRDGDEFVLEGSPGDIVSLIPLSEFVSGLTTQGLRWPLHDKLVEFGTTLTVSNEMISEKARVTIRAGNLLLMHREGHDSRLESPDSE